MLYRHSKRQKESEQRRKKTVGDEKERQANSSFKHTFITTTTSFPLCSSLSFQKHGFIKQHIHLHPYLLSNTYNLEPHTFTRPLLDVNLILRFLKPRDCRQMSDSPLLQLKCPPPFHCGGGHHALAKRGLNGVRPLALQILVRISAARAHPSEACLAFHEGSCP
jgi:hypothetical protein